MTDDRFGLSGKTALVTGAGQGIGQAVALAMARAGADVICHERAEVPTATLSAVEQMGRRAFGVTGDLGDRAAPESMVTAALAAAAFRFARRALAPACAQDGDSRRGLPDGVHRGLALGPGTRSLGSRRRRPEGAERNRVELLADTGGGRAVVADHAGSDAPPRRHLPPEPPRCHLWAGPR